MDERLQKIEEELKAIAERNRRVEADKAWETSLFRLLSISLITYVVAAFVLYLIEVQSFFRSALVPVAGFVLSVQSLPMIKRWWIGRFLRK